MKNRRKILIDKKRFKFYMWMGFAFFLLWLPDVIFHYPGEFIVRSLNYTWATCYLIVLNFIFLEYTLPKVSRKRFFKSLLILAGGFFLYSYGLYAWRFIGIQVHVYTALKAFTSISAGVFYNFTYGLCSIIFFGIIKHIYDYQKLKKAAQQLRIEKQEAELSYLKSQTNPHFLFNTLNNIYSLSKDKSDLAPESILRLSKILRFMLYETGGEYIAMEEEMKIITDYIALEKLRYDESLRVNFNYDIEDMKQAIPPLLLMPLVENAFKHGVSETRDQPFVDIHLSAKQRRVEFVVKNSSEAPPEERSVKENIGLSNLRRQLELLYTDFNLSVKQGESVFTATLKINLASHV